MQVVCDVFTNSTPATSRPWYAPPRTPLACSWFALHGCGPDGGGVVDGCADDDLDGGGGRATDVDGGGWAVLVAVLDLGCDGRGRRDGVTVRVAVVRGSTREGRDEVAGGVDEDGAADVAGADDTLLTVEPAVVRPEDEHEVSTSVSATIAAAGDQRVITRRCAGRSSRAGSAAAASARRAAGPTSSSRQSPR